jgi:hypothetical protein
MQGVATACCTTARARSRIPPLAPCATTICAAAYRAAEPVGVMTPFCSARGARPSLAIGHRRQGEHVLGNEHLM